MKRIRLIGCFILLISLMLSSMEVQATGDVLINASDEPEAQEEAAFYPDTPEADLSFTTDEADTTEGPSPDDEPQADVESAVSEEDAPVSVSEEETPPTQDGADEDGTPAESSAEDAALTETPTVDSVPAGTPESTMLSTPILTGVENTKSGVKVTWEAVPGAEAYRVFRKTASSGWKRLADVTTLSYTDTNTSPGTQYTYTVRCITDSGAWASGYDAAGQTITRLTQPAVSVSARAETGVIVRWDAVAGADTYRVYRKVDGDTGWTRLTETSSLTYTDTSAVCGVKYRYTVRARCGNDSSSHDTTGAIITPLEIPTLVDAENTKAGVKVTWEAVPGAETYRVFRKTESSGWKRLSDVTTLSYTDTTAASGTQYTYTVRCITDSGAWASGYDAAGQTITRLTQPAVSASARATSGITIRWDAVTGAKTYRVYRKADGDTAWTRLTETSSLTYTDMTAVCGTKYRYTVRARCGNDSSSHDTTGAIITPAETPVLTGAVNVASGVKVTWDAAPGGKVYRVFRKTESSGWKRLADVTALSYTDTTAVSNTQYTYTVRCITDSGAWASGYDAAGRTVKYYAAPALTDISYSNMGFKISWNSVAGAEKYRVFRKTGSSGWKKLADVTTLSYTDANAVPGTKNSYTVRCISSDGKTFLSGYDENGKSVSASKVTMCQKAEDYGSSTSWLLLVDTSSCELGVFNGSRGNWTLTYFWDCSPGAYSTPTVKGTFTVGYKGYSFYSYGSLCYYYTQFYGNYLIHSIPYNANGTVQDSRLGMNLSHGCVRLATGNARWIYNNIPTGTKVVVY